jgi:anti-sigma factor RsiW
MNHNQAVDQMVAEKYLLDELSPEARDAFEEHFFDCPQCALDLRAGAVFVRAAKTELTAIEASAPAMEKAAEAVAPPNAAGAKPKNSLWSTLLSWTSRPAFAAPAFAALLLVLVYQNAVTFPALRSAANQPRLVPVAPVRGATRGASHIVLSADRRYGVALPVDLPSASDVAPGIAPAASYAFDLRDPQGKLAWSGSIPAPAQQSESEQTYSLLIPGAMLRNGSYSLTVTGVSAQGVRSPAEQLFFDIVLTD